MVMVSLRAEVPEPLLQSMRGFIEAHPHWDQYRLFQAALAGFLVQNGLQSREVTRCYLANLFPQKTGFGPRLAPGPRSDLTPSLPLPPAVNPITAPGCGGADGGWGEGVAAGPSLG